MRKAPNIRMTFLLDIVAMTFGRPHSLFPALGAVVFGGGATIVGVLTAALASGSILLNIFSGRISSARAQSRGISRSIYLYGVAMIAFGVVVLISQPATAGNLNLSALVFACLCLVLAGAADAVSAIYRGAILQAAVPDEMRGRLILVCVAWLVRAHPHFNRYDASVPRR